jgi:C1A family cysteine protease
MKILSTFFFLFIGSLAISSDHIKLHNEEIDLSKRKYSKSGISVNIIPSKILSNGEQWYNFVLEQEGGTCTSHAVTAALAYAHGKHDIIPYYIHKHVQYNQGVEQTYDRGILVEDAMNFVYQKGVPAYEGKNFYKDSGYPFPENTTKYSFQYIYNVNTRYSGSMSEKIHQALDEFEHPVVISFVSSAGLKDGDKMKLKNHMEPVKYVFIEGVSDNQNFSITYAPGVVASKYHQVISKENAHSMIVFGYKEKTNKSSGYFYVKNSWGDGNWALKNVETGQKIQTTKFGNVKISYDYINKHANDYSPFVGIGQKFIQPGQNQSGGCYLF